ncbi:MAG TPA: class II glutamine amidotransferase [Candidatus Heimdallarchaeota archaeon]|nr:class II glutamine amidotransferase [Candidatus Heimdallarchaeota archaeon]
MCRMIAAPFGIPGSMIVESFVRMAHGENVLHEHNQSLGKFRHPDGWGVVYNEGGSYESCRSVRPCWEDKGLEGLKDRTIILMHARHASRGRINLANVHPFHIEHKGRSWYFCHNGTIDDPAIAGYNGGTDSERYFRFLLQHLDLSSPTESIKAAVSTLHAYTSLNACLTDGDHFYIINRFSSSPRYYTLYLHQSEDGPIISSEPLPDVAADWEPLGNGRIIAYEARAKKSTLIR